jgi:hypothetical protein
MNYPPQAAGYRRKRLSLIRSFLSPQTGAFTIEMAVTVTPACNQKGGFSFSPILVMHDGTDQRQLAIWQARIYTDKFVKSS